MSTPRFRSLVLDVDSTLCGVEGIDWLAERRGPEVARQVAGLTARAMKGEVALESVYGERLALITPSRSEIETLARVYEQTIAPGAREVIRTIRGAGVRVVAVSGGIRAAISPLTNSLGIELRAVDVRFGADGQYAGVEASPLATQTGKRDVVRALMLERPALAVGDGATDTAMRAAVDAFAAYTGFVRRESVVAGADAEITSFAQLLRYVMGSPGP